MNAIDAQGLTKVYRIGARERYVALRDRLAGLFRRRGPAPLVRVLDDVSFKVAPGEVLGLIGRNGAGKTTLLKILARITWPTAGRAHVRGRVGSLLEVGAGMHPELTGRENVYLNGAVLGMRRREIVARFDEIVAFAEIGDFLDTPLKRYSSGMRVRLAFAVAAHLEPDILFVDEVLAVGDLRFQRKCMGKMDEVAKTGRTIVFVTHQMNQIRRLCQRVLWLDGGALRQDGPAAEVVSAYEAAMSSGAAAPAATDKAKAAFTAWTLDEPKSGEPHILADFGPLSVRFHLRVNRPLRSTAHGIALFDGDSRLVWGTQIDNLDLAAGEHDLVHTLPGLPLKPGPYFWRVSLYDDEGLCDVYEGVPPLTVATEPMGHSRDEWAGILNFPSEFKLV